MTPAKPAPVTSLYWTIFKWSLMAACIFWTFVYRLSDRGNEISGFVYANL